MGATLRVLHVLASISSVRGGPSVAVRNTMKALHQRGVAVDVVTTDDDGDTKRLEVPLDRFVQLYGQRVRYFPRQTVKYAASYPLLRWLSLHVSDYDVVHTHGLFSFAPVAAAWHARSSGVPYIMRPAGVLDTWGMKNKSRIVKATSVRMVEGPLLRSAAAVHFMTRLEQTRASELPLSIRPVVLPLGFEFDTYVDEGRPPIDDLNIGAKRAILYLARIHPIKCVDVLLRAFASLPERNSTVLLIAGDGDPQLVTSLKRLTRELGIDEHVQWVGFAAGARKRWLLSLATIFALPSASENFGVAVVEAMNAGLPVVVTRGCGLAELVARARAGLVTDGSVEGLRAALSQILADDDLRRAMGAAGRQAVGRELSLDAFGNRLESLYRNILADRNAQAAAAASPGLRL
jgi:glycosyltransferase involved in cell wall biosynthesis